MLILCFYLILANSLYQFTNFNVNVTVDPTNADNKLIDLEGKTYNCPQVTADWESFTIKNGIWECDSYFLVSRNSSFTFEDVTFRQTSNINFGSAQNSSLTFNRVQFESVNSIATEETDLNFNEVQFLNSDMAFINFQSFVCSNCAFSEMSNLHFSQGLSMEITQSTHEYSTCNIIEIENVESVKLDQVSIKNSKLELHEVKQIDFNFVDIETKICEELINMNNIQEASLYHSYWICPNIHCANLNVNSTLVVNNVTILAQSDARTLTPLKIKYDPLLTEFTNFEVSCSAGRSGCFADDTFTCEVCSETSYSLDEATWRNGDVTPGECQKCPELGATCYNGKIDANKYYYLQPETKTITSDCFGNTKNKNLEIQEAYLCAPGYCLEENGVGCTKGRSGVLCGSCESGKYDVFGTHECRSSCDDFDLILFGSLCGGFILLFSMFVVLFTNVKDSHFSSAVYISIYFLQMMSFYIDRFELSSAFEYVKQGLNFFRFDFVSLFDVEESDIAVFCLNMFKDDFNIFWKKVISLLIPLICVPFVLIFTCLFSRCRVPEEERPRIASLTNLFFFTAAGLFNKIGELVMCVEIDGELVMLYYGEEKCYTYLHVIPFTLAVLFLGWLIYLRYTHHKIWNAREYMNSVILFRYQEYAWYFPAIACLFRVIIGFLTSTLAYYPVLQPLVIGLVSGIYIAVVHELQPHKHQSTNRFKSIYFFMLTFLAVLNACVGVYVYESQEIREGIIDSITAFIVIGCLLALGIPICIYFFTEQMSDRELRLKERQELVAHRASSAGNLRADIDKANEEMAENSYDNNNEVGENKNSGIIEMGEYENREINPGERHSDKESEAHITDEEDSEDLAKALHHRYDDKFRQPQLQDSSEIINEYEQPGASQIRDDIQPGSSQIRESVQNIHRQSPQRQPMRPSQQKQMPPHQNYHLDGQPQELRNSHSRLRGSQQRPSANRHSEQRRHPHDSKMQKKPTLEVIL